MSVSLSHNTIVDLARSGITTQIAHQHHISDINCDEIGEHLNLKRAPSSDGYLLPYYALDGKRDETHDRVRLHTPMAHTTKNGKKKEIRYLQRPKSGCGMYLPRAVLKWSKIARDTEQPLVGCEGEKKAISACVHGLTAIGFGGVFNATPNQQLLPQLAEFELDGRSFEIAFDGDRATKPLVQLAEQRLGGLLFERHAHVQIVVLPPGEKLDDFLLTHSADDFRKLDRVPFTERDCLTHVRHRKGLNADERRAAGAQMVLRGMIERGKFLQDNSELLYFDNTEQLLLRLDDPKNRELRAFVSANYGIDGAASEWAAVHEALANHCTRSGVEATTHPFAYYNKIKHTIYIAASDRQMYRITRKGHELVPNGTDDVLMRSRGRIGTITLAKGKPSRAALDLLVNIPNFKAGHATSIAELRMLYRVAILAPLFPQLMPTKSIVLFHGPMGSLKTAGAHAVGLTLLGDEFDVCAFNPKKLDGLDAELTSSPFCVVDNADGRIPDLENRFATAATGGAIVLRKLYTTLEAFRARIIAYVWATSRDPASFVRKDVTDRLSYFPCERSDEFISEEAALERVRANRPKFWAYLLDIMPKMLEALRTYEPRPMKFRMADHAHFCLAVAPVLGIDRKRMQHALELMELEKQQFASHESVLPMAFENLIKEAVDYQERGAPRSYIGVPLSATELLNALAAAWPGGASKFPFKRAVTLGAEVQAQLTALRSDGIDLTATHDKRAKAWRYTLRLTELPKNPAPEGEK